ncbi:Transcriptional regulator, GntR family, in hypothetical Actinobacterial gene cluster [Alloactinosynnema sp. L-07]|uniref:FadR/GntR family transcriptional regulator n=1 Tax=Alloactinosynnema sp. L-07 TaxID=1653480 RepID=UPI00065EF3B1|nr:GntR family transcriptional regulator [Alloactinosynnema sp. L-07]CRK57864.1 Transcriptional regulator, GntR family, in hypothetical Actinobacterial gene cluster [Alloactinosynnema sp. L-07]
MNAPTVPVATDVDGAFLRPILGGNPYEETVERIVQAIKLGHFAAGDRLPPERDLAARLQVSRVTLRSAIRSLQQAGLIESRRGRTGGSFVIWRPDLQLGNALGLAREMGDALIDALRYRSALEPGAARLAATNSLDAAQREELWARAAEAREASLADYRLADVRFHLAIANAAGSTSLGAAVADVQLRLSDLLGAIPLLPVAVEHSNEQHDRILQAILAGNGKLAHDIMDEHISATATLLRGFLG